MLSGQAQAAEAAAQNGRPDKPPVMRGHQGGERHMKRMNPDEAAKRLNKTFGVSEAEVKAAFKEKRDYKRHPRRGAEEVQAQKWKEACRGASMIIKDKTHPRYGELRARWNAQLKGQPDALLDPKRVTMFPNFVRVILLKELESGSTP